MDYGRPLARGQQRPVRGRVIMGRPAVPLRVAEQRLRRDARQPRGLPREVRLVGVAGVGGEARQLAAGVLVALRQGEEALEPQRALQSFRADSRRPSTATS